MYHIPCKDMKTCLSICFHCVDQNRLTNSARRKKKNLHSEIKYLCFRRTNSTSSWAAFGQRVNRKYKLLPETRVFEYLFHKCPKYLSFKVSCKFCFLQKAKFINYMRKTKIFPIQYSTIPLKQVQLSENIIGALGLCSDHQDDSIQLHKQKDQHLNTKL